MAFVHGKNTTVYIDYTDFSSYFNNVDTSRSADVAESTTFGVNSKTYITGMKDGTISIGGFFDATADATIQPLLGGNDFVISVGIDGLDANDSCIFQKGNITSYGVSSPVGDIVATSMDIQSDAGLFNGKVLENNTYTTTTSGTARDNTTSTGNGGGAFLIVTSASGTTPTLDAKITHSADDVTYADLVTFTQATGQTAEVKTVAEDTTVNRYLKAVFTIGGTTPSFSAIIGFGRNN